ncbi:metal ABC transporter ATP-binding protein [Agrilactobacillus yilanensis]|uniref:Metal ABC transporter ATP-binding protein n=1 Tax=Agrilactobacillus yilanensis TaxID=2485997 RepID=A0ABW4J7G2_9LACO|nr:metal ABC transporter ATP-binding protein [Agrilactobacillus yilanensis]
MLEIKNLTVAYDNSPVFEALDVTFESGKITGIIGPNGAGKSTLIKGLLNLIPKRSGSVLIDGQKIKKVSNKIAYVEQRKALDLTFPINVFDVVLTGTYGKLGLFKVPGNAEKQIAYTALDQVNLLDYQDRQIGNLSGGQLQRVFVARAIAQEADIIILDEPFVGIDIKSERDIMAIIKYWRDEGKTIIVVHHDLNKVFDYFDNLVILNHGIVASGSVAQTYTPENIQQAFSADLSAVLFDDTKKVGSAS